MRLVWEDNFRGSDSDVPRVEYDLGYGTATDDIQGSLLSIALAAGGAYGVRGGVALTGARVPDDFELLLNSQTNTGSENYLRITWRTSDTSAATNGSDIQYGYRLESVPLFGTLKLERMDNYSATSLASPGYTFTNGARHWIRIRAERDRIQVKVWDNGSAEPGAWQIDVTDGTYPSGDRLIIALLNGWTGDAVSRTIGGLSVWDLGATPRRARLR